MATDAEELNEGTDALDNDRDQLVSMDAGLFNVFDDDVDEECLNDMAIDYDVLSFEGESIEELLGSVDSSTSKSMSIGADKKPAAAALTKPKKKRQSLRIEHADRGLPPPRWHSEAADKPHRKTMQVEMYVSNVLQGGRLLRKCVMTHDSSFSLLMCLRAMFQSETAADAKEFAAFRDLVETAAS